MRLFLAGDIHGNTKFLTDYLYPMAAAAQADTILQVGDFGYWEHVESGAAFLDAASRAAQKYEIPLYWLHGNHDKHSLVLSKYGHCLRPDGFITIRPLLNYIPQGLVWTWAGHRLRAFGGAYSVDKQYRLDLEANRARNWHIKAAARRADGQHVGPAPSFAGTLWFPEEETSDEEFEELLAADSTRLSAVFSHDKPRASNVGLDGFKDLPPCLPNQRRLQRALLAHQPQFWIHGHLHHPYTDMVRCGDDGAFTTVVGLSCDDEAAQRFWKPAHAWGLLDLIEGGRAIFTSGRLAEDDLDLGHAQ